MWRNPDAELEAFFGGGSYRTVLATVGAKKAKIEKRVGATLDSDETQFKGKQARSKLRAGEDIEPAHPQAVKASRVVALSVKKLLVAYEELNIADR